jgi:hypothetical protein
MATDDRLSFVQFPHPGREHSLATGLEWSAFPDHYRRFMVQPGVALDKDEVVRANLCFWGEWEAGATSSVPLIADRAGMPTHIFEPAIRDKMPTGFIQNTDPLVFGRSFFYTNCKQRGDGKLKHLAHQSLILFGSRVNKKFCLDTVFVVADSRWYHPDQATQSPFSFATELLTNVTIEPISRANGDRRLRAYRGLRHDETAATFSFVPCSTLDKHPHGFSRPSIHLPDPATGEDLIKHGMTQSYRSVVSSVDGIERLWTSVVDQVRDQGLMLGISLAEPVPV